MRRTADIDIELGAVGGTMTPNSGRGKRMITWIRVPFGCLRDGTLKPSKEPVPLSIYTRL